nr:hypothetical protein CFP56_78076 [Quercus suber]
MSLVTSDGDVVIERTTLPSGAVPGQVLELRFSLQCKGKAIAHRPAFPRVDKASANGTIAVRNVISSFTSVRKDQETRRRGVLLWCETLRGVLLKQAIASTTHRKIILDIGSGTGQSLDTLTADKGVSYILVEPDSNKCEMLKRRISGSRVVSNPREILSNMKALKSGLQTYMVLNCALRDIVQDEQLMRTISSELLAATAIFSAHYVIPELYDLSNYWSVPIVGCMYPYNGVTVGESLVSCLGITMRRASESECEVTWGGDAMYMEPCTTTQEYQAFASVFPASDLLPCPSFKLDKEIFGVCSKVHVVMSL